MLPTEPDEGSTRERDALGNAPTLVAGDGTLESTEHPQALEEPLDASPRQTLGRYVVLGTLGRGGMGTVLEAFDRTLDRRVALKVLHRDLDEQHTKRLLREAQALAKLSHPNVVQVYEVGRAGGQAFVAMELVPGCSLREWIARDPRPSWRDCTSVYLQAGQGLAAAHARGLVHRDFKPGNAVVDEEGRVRVLDFGLARWAGGSVQEEPSGESSREPSVDEEALAQSLTRTGAMLGTPGYMAPEQLEGREADARSDQFGYCVALYEALYGERPFEGSSMAALRVSMLSGQVRSVPRGSIVPAAVRMVVLRGLAIDPSARWPSMDALLGELRRIVSPRRRGWLALGVTGGLAAIGLGIAHYAEVGFRCEGAAAQLEGIWDDEQRHAVETAILGTQLSYAADTWVRVEQRLDEYSQHWTDKHTEVCEATSVRQEQSTEVMDLRMECLRGRKLALRETVKVLAQADATRVENAVDLLASLPGLSRCDDVEALAAELPPPEDTDVAVQVEALRESLVQARVLREAGEYEDALVIAEPLVEQAEELAYMPLVAEALLERGRVRHQLGPYAKAEQDVERAYLVAAEHGHEAVEAAAVSQLIRIVGIHQARLDAGLQWGKTALALAKGPRVAPEAEAVVLDGIGAVLHEQGNLEEALVHHQCALAIEEQALGPRHPAVANSLNHAGTVLRAQGQLEEALRHHQRALAIREQALGAHHPVVAQSLSNIGSVLLEQGKLEEALTHYERALAIWERALGSRHADIAFALGDIGSVLKAQGKLEEALKHHQRALAIREEALGPRHPKVAASLNDIGTVLLEQGKQEDALLYLRRAMGIAEEVLGPRHRDIAVALANIGGVLWSQGKGEQALVHLQRALAIFEETLGPRHPELAPSLINIGGILWEQGKGEEALGSMRRALAIWEEALGPRHPAVGSLLANLGIMLTGQGEQEEAELHLQRALTIQEEALGPRHPDVAHALVALAELALAKRDLEGAREHAERALSIREASEPSPELLAEARFVLASALWADRSQHARAHTLGQQASDAYAKLGDATQAELAKVQAWLREHPAPS